MLSDEKNRQLTQVSAGTPMGELLRRYWMPIAGVGHGPVVPDSPSSCARSRSE